MYHALHIIYYFSLKPSLRHLYTHLIEETPDSEGKALVLRLCLPSYKIAKGNGGTPRVLDSLSPLPFIIC